MARVACGRTIFGIVSARTVLAIKDKAIRLTDGNTPWANKDFEPGMWRKTAMIALAKVLPGCPNLLRAVALDQRAEDDEPREVEVEVVEPKKGKLEQLTERAEADAEPIPEPPTEPEMVPAMEPPPASTKTTVPQPERPETVQSLVPEIKRICAELELDLGAQMSRILKAPSPIDEARAVIAGAKKFQGE